MYMIPKKPVFVNKPSKADTPEYGEYVVKAAGCIDCHTLERKGKIYMDKAFAGGREFRMPMKTVVSANITPSVSTGIGNWTPEAFVARFKAYDPATGPLPKASSVGFNTPMPWSMYAGMDTIDLLAMHTYLRSLKPIENAVIKLR